MSDYQHDLRRFSLPLSPRLPALLLLLSIIALVLYVLYFDNGVYSVYDDSFISFRYAQNLAWGHGLVFNPGEQVEGYTNFAIPQKLL
jgi:arabinofuranosyltransferase